MQRMREVGARACGFDLGALAGGQRHARAVGALRLEAFEKDIGQICRAHAFDGADLVAERQVAGLRRRVGQPEIGEVEIALAAVPLTALYWPVRKIAAVAALTAGAGYLALSGGNVATERAYIMVAVMFVAVLVGRRAITLRSVAVAALVVLALRPEALSGPGLDTRLETTTSRLTGRSPRVHLVCGPN